MLSKTYKMAAAAPVFMDYQIIPCTTSSSSPQRHFMWHQPFNINWNYARSRFSYIWDNLTGEEQATKILASKLGKSWTRRRIEKLEFKNNQRVTQKIISEKLSAMTLSSS